jgi:hypothetical protein
VALWHLDGTTDRKVQGPTVKALLKHLNPRPSLPLLLLLLLLPPRQPTGPCDLRWRLSSIFRYGTGLATKQQRFEESIRIGIKLMNAKNDSAVGRWSRWGAFETRRETRRRRRPVAESGHWKPRYCML